MKRTKIETRARILEAAKELLSKKSAQFIQLRDIADRAGVSASLLVQYFGSKEELVFEARLGRLSAETRERFAEPGGETIGEVIGRWFDQDLAVPAATKDLLSLSWWWSQEDERRFLEATEPRLAALRRAIAAEKVPKDAMATVERALTMLYWQVLREACVSGAGPQEASEVFLPLARLALDR